jgi:hypothetical protein
MTANIAWILQSAKARHGAEAADSSNAYYAYHACSDTSESKTVILGAGLIEESAKP